MLYSAHVSFFLGVAHLPLTRPPRHPFSLIEALTGLYTGNTSTTIPSVRASFQIGARAHRHLGSQTPDGWAPGRACHTPCSCFPPMATK